MVIRQAVNLLALVLLLLGCQPAPEPFLDIEGWSPRGDPSRHGPDELWEVINGAADAFLDYGFELLTVQTYSAGELTVSIHVYDMGDPLNAFGIYRTEAPVGSEPLDVGTEAVVSPPYQCLLLKDRYYVKVEAYEGELDAATGAELVGGIAATLPGTDDMPPALAALPAHGMVPGTARYVKSGLLGLGELQDAVHAQYRNEDGSEYQAFVLLAPADGSVDDVWSGLAESWQQTDHDGQPVLFREVPYEGLVGVVRGEAGLVSVAGCADHDQLERRIDRLTAE